MLCYRLKTSILLLDMVLFLLLSSCQSNALSAPKKAHPVTPTMIVIVEGFQSEASITLIGTVQDVMRSARIIMLQEPIEGFLYVALTQDTRLISIEGQNIVLQDIKAGMRIRVTGRPGSPGTLLAEEVQLLP